MNREFNEEVRADVADGNIEDESNIPLFTDTDNISVIVSTEHSVHVQMFEPGELPANLNNIIKGLEYFASSLVLEAINIKDDRPLVVHLNESNIHFRTAAEIMCYIDGMQHMWDIIYDRNTNFSRESGGPNENGD